MGMKFSIATASDVISKGLDPRYPHRDLGHDGMLRVASSPETPKASAVVSVSAPVEEAPPPPASSVSSPLEVDAAVVLPAEKKEEEVIPSPLAEEEEKKVASEPPVSVSAQPVEKAEEKLPESTEDKKSVVKTPRAKTPKTPPSQ